MKQKLIPTIARFVVFATIEPTLDWIERKKHRVMQRTKLDAIMNVVYVIEWLRTFHEPAAPQRTTRSHATN